MKSLIISTSILSYEDLFFRCFADKNLQWQYRMGDKTNSPPRNRQKRTIEIRYKRGSEDSKTKNNAGITFHPISVIVLYLLRFIIFFLRNRGRTKIKKYNESQGRVSQSHT